MIIAGPNNEEKKAATIQVLKGDNNSFDNWQVAIERGDVPNDFQAFQDVFL